MKIRPDTTARIIDLRRHQSLSVNTIANKLGLSRRTVSNVLRGDLSPLNIRTTRKYQRCQEKGGCIPSRTLVTRPFATGDFAIPECKRCKVPMAGRLKKGWAA